MLPQADLKCPHPVRVGFPVCFGGGLRFIGRFLATTLLLTTSHRADSGGIGDQTRCGALRYQLLLRLRFGEVNEVLHHSYLTPSQGSSTTR